MKRTIIVGVVAYVVGLTTPQVVEAQGTITYVSNLGQTSSGAVSVGSDSWYAADFITGNNAGGYALNSIQLAMTDASGGPNGFTVMLYSSVSGIATFPGTGLGTLAGSADPTAAGAYTYAPVSSLTLAPNTYYFIVLTAGTTVANGAYDWSVTGTSSPGYNSYHWGGEIFFADSTDGSHWSYTSANYGQFSLDATATPEPGVISLFALGGLLVAFRRRKASLVE
jgi:hypothetical protein